MDALVIFNPNASRVNDHARAAVLGALGHHRFDTAETDHAGHATELAAQAAADGRRLVVAVGGDGTANEAANGIVGTQTALWCLPAGSTNVYARTLGAPDDLEAATALLAHHGREPAIRRTTTGTVDGRHFLYMSGIGATAAVMRRAAERPVLRARMGVGFVAAGAVATLTDVGRGRLPKVLVQADGRSERAATVIVQRSDPLTYFGRRAIHVCPREHLGDGELSVALADRVGVGGVASIIARLLSGDPARLFAHPGVHGLERLEGLRVVSEDGRPFDLEVDGTYVGARERADYGVARDSLLVAGP